MKKIAKFEKVSLEQYLTDMKKKFDIDEEQLINFYNNILLPKRTT